MMPNHPFLIFQKVGVAEWEKCNCILVTKMNPSKSEMTWTTPDCKNLTRTTPEPQSYGRVMEKYGGAITALWYAKQLDFE